MLDNERTFLYDYNCNDDRIRSTIVCDGDTIFRRYYLGGCYELDVTQEGAKERLYLDGDYYDAVAVYTKNYYRLNTDSLFYILRDYQGSITHVLTPSGNVVQELSYDAWGRLRDPNTHQVYRSYEQPDLILGRGYTGHEHISNTGLIHMNARVYDPALGRFISPDPYVQDPENSQNYNRYSYCVNNPLIHTDESGELFGIIPILTTFTNGIVNLIKHGFNVSRYDWTRTKFSWKIEAAVFKGNPLQVAHNLTRGFFNTMTGQFLAHMYNTFHQLDDITTLDGCTAIGGGFSSSKAMTIGPFSIGPDNYKADWKDNLFVHEYGHYIQSERLGIFYLPFIALPSGISAASNKTDPLKHRNRLWERRANNLTAQYFNRYYGINSKNHQNDKDFFSPRAFERGLNTPYKNPRLNSYDQSSNNYVKVYPIYKNKFKY